MDPIWRLKVSDWAGTFKFVQDMGSLLIDGSPTFEVDSAGDCRECTFRGMVAISDSDWVDVEASTDGVTWTPYYSGVATQVRTGYNPDAGGYKLVGGMKRLEEVECRGAILPNTLASQYQSFWSALIVTGQLGNAMNPAVDTPDLPATLTGAGVQPNYQSAATILKTVLAPRYPGSVVAITARRQLRIWKPVGTHVFDEQDRNVKVVWGDIDAEEVVSHVRFLWARSAGGRWAGSLGGDPIPFATGLPASALIQAVPAPSRISVKPIALASTSADHFLPLQASTLRFPVPSNGTPTSNGVYALTGSVAALCDGDRTTALTVLIPDTDPGPFQMDVNYGNTAAPLGIEFDAQGIALSAVTLYDQGSGYTVRLDAPVGASGYYLIPDAVRDWMAAHFTGSTTLTFTYDRSGPGPIQLRAACLLTANLDTLTPIAQAAGRTPAVQAGTITVPDWVDPRPHVQITRRDETYQVILGTSTVPAALYRYRVTPAGELQTEISIGQKDTPEQSAQAALIKQRDQLSALGAVRASV